MAPRWNVAFRCDHVFLSIMSDTLESALNTPHEVEYRLRNDTLLVRRHPRRNRCRILIDRVGMKMVDCCAQFVCVKAFQRLMQVNGVIALDGALERLF